jgi:regulator of CtrA degradation
MQANNNHSFTEHRYRGYLGENSIVKNKKGFKNPIDRTFDEGVALTMEARNYIAFHEQSDRKSLNLPDCLHIGYHHTRVSARLIQIMTWLLAMKAVNNGEISSDQFRSPAFALGGGPECVDASGPDLLDLPVGLRSLLERTYTLYMRVKRLDDQVRGQPVLPTDAAVLAREGVTQLQAVT